MRKSPQKIRVVHVINSFEYGGAEAMLCDLVVRTDRSRFEPHVVALIDDLTVARPILDACVPLAVMGMRPGFPDPRGVARLVGHLRQLRPDIVQTWMDHSNLIGGLAGKVAPHSKVVWGIHHSAHVPGVAKRSTLLTVSACAILARRLAARVVSCSEHARRLYVERGFPEERMTVIPNGFDTQRFRPGDGDSRGAVRHELGIAVDAPVVGLVARFDPFKDHLTFLRAAANLARRMPTARFLLIGAGVDAANAELARHLTELRISDRCILLGARRDLARLYPAMDVLASSSISEAFPLVLGEAMSCGVSCVATDVGDSALIVGTTGRIAPARDPGSLADACFATLTMEPTARARLGSSARQRVCEMFDLGVITRRYEALYTTLCGANAYANQPGATTVGPVLAPKLQFVRGGKALPGSSRGGGPTGASIAAAIGR